jgi:hypothetical protein
VPKLRTLAKKLAWPRIVNYTQSGRSASSGPGDAPVPPVEQAAQSWHAARRGLRFTSLPDRPWTTAAELGCLVALTDMNPTQVKALPDVQAIGRLSESRSGRGDLALLDCLGRFGSIRDLGTACADRKLGY